MTDRDDHFRLLIDRAAAPLQGDVYAVLDLSGPAAAAVRSIRAQFSYDYFGAMPVEITITGSGGVGSPTVRGDPRPFFAALDEIVDSTAPIRGDEVFVGNCPMSTGDWAEVRFSVAIGDDDSDDNATLHFVPAVGDAMRWLSS